MNFAGDVVLDAVAPAVGDDADDMPDLGLTRLVRPRNDPSQLEALGQRIRGTEHALHEGLVDHGDELAALAVGGGDATASRDAHAHQAEVLGRDDVHPREGAVLGVHRRLAGIERHPECALEWQAGGHRGRATPGSAWTSVSIRS